MKKIDALTLRRFRTLTGQARKVAVRDYLKAHGVDFTKTCHTISQESRAVLADMAKAVCWRKPVGCGFSLGCAYFNYLSRGV